MPKTRCSAALGKLSVSCESGWAPLAAQVITPSRHFTSTQNGGNKKLGLTIPIKKGFCLYEMFYVHSFLFYIKRGDRCTCKMEKRNYIFWWERSWKYTRLNPDELIWPHWVFAKIIDWWNNLKKDWIDCWIDLLKPWNYWPNIETTENMTTFNKSQELFKFWLNT